MWTSQPSSSSKGAPAMPHPHTLEHKFKRGDEATVAKKMTWKIPSKTDPEYRKDIMPGTKGTIKGFNGYEGRHMLLKCIVPHRGLL